MSTLPQAPQTTTTPSMTTQSALTDSRLRVVLLLDVRSGAEERFLRAYDELCQQVASVPGHLSDQLCQSIEDPSKWLITSEWESAPPFLAWVDSAAHREMVKPMHGCVKDTRSLRFGILRETDHGTGPAANRGRLQPAPRIGDGVVRHALTFTVKPGSEKDVAAILANYASPESRVDDTTRLCRTSLFMSGNRVVRAVEVQGELMAALRHVSRQPEIREVEEAINPYLEEARDLDDPESAREFFMRAALTAVHHLSVKGAGHSSADIRRHALLYPVKEGCGMAVARLLARQDELAIGGEGAGGRKGRGKKGAPAVVTSTIFHHVDTVVRLVDITGSLDQDPALFAGVGGKRAAAMLSRLVEVGPGRELSDEAGLRRFLADCDMTPVTDRRAADY
ncbi:SchA/CurD-like domain-containing protein [Streptomyces coffeae]|uniref:Antibiotic biosynthesis monooxygenase n=1 Tax=Streptomyces coffeae TaxID=621382 RepID=A0ABS1NL71_9ACTN|nr:SchA/CurD-like domain-containing protein [Streptomyces coffeae]MBL1100842.1 antibiotic biosynthesis monooxygenase [Streptomyces coffeae]